MAAMENKIFSIFHTEKITLSGIRLSGNVAWGIQNQSQFHGKNSYISS